MCNENAKIPQKLIWNDREGEVDRRRNEKTKQIMT